MKQLLLLISLWVFSTHFVNAQLIKFKNNPSYDSIRIIPKFPKENQNVKVIVYISNEVDSRHYLPGNFSLENDTIKLFTESEELVPTHTEKYSDTIYLGQLATGDHPVLLAHRRKVDFGGLEPGSVSYEDSISFRLNIAPVLNNIVLDTLYLNTFNEGVIEDSVFSNPYDFYVSYSSLDSNFDGSPFIKANSTDNVFELNFDKLNLDHYDSIKVVYNLFAKNANNYIYPLPSIGHGEFSVMSDVSFKVYGPEFGSTFGYYYPIDWRQEFIVFIDNLRIIGYRSEVLTSTTHKTAAKHIVMISDLLGNKISENDMLENQIYIIKYSDGSSKKTFNE